MVLSLRFVSPHGCRDAIVCVLRLQCSHRAVQASSQIAHLLQPLHGLHEQLGRVWGVEVCPRGCGAPERQEAKPVGLPVLLTGLRHLSSNIKADWGTLLLLLRSSQATVAETVLPVRSPELGMGEADAALGAWASPKRMQRASSKTHSTVSYNSLVCSLLQRLDLSALAL